MTPGDRLTIAVPAGKVDPMMQVRTAKPIRLTIEVVAIEERGVRVKFHGCYPPNGFRVGWEHWKEAWEPFVGRITPKPENSGLDVGPGRAIASADD